MSHWEPGWKPDMDLVRLLEALAEEVVATTAPEVREVCAGHRWCVGRSVKEVRELIDAASDPAALLMRIDAAHRIGFIEPIYKA